MHNETYDTTHLYSERTDEDSERYTFYRYLVVIDTYWCTVVNTPHIMSSSNDVAPCQVSIQGTRWAIHMFMPRVTWNYVWWQNCLHMCLSSMKVQLSKRICIYTRYEESYGFFACFFFLYSWMRNHDIMMTSFCRTWSEQHFTYNMQLTLRNT